LTVSYTRSWRFRWMGDVL